MSRSGWPSFSSCPKQPPRESCDGEIHVSTLGAAADEHGYHKRFVISVMHDGRSQSMEMSGFNLWRLFGALSLFLGVRLAKKVGKSINLSGKGSENA